MKQKYIITALLFFCCAVTTYGANSIKLSNTSDRKILIPKDTEYLIKNDGTYKNIFVPKSGSNRRQHDIIFPDINTIGKYTWIDPQEQKKLSFKNKFFIIYTNETSYPTTYFPNYKVTVTKKKSLKNALLFLNTIEQGVTKEYVLNKGKVRIEDLYRRRHYPRTTNRTINLSL